MVETPQKVPKLNREFEFYIQHQASLVNKYKGRYLVIIGEDVVGDYASFAEAYQTSVAQYELGTFLIQHCMPGMDNYTQTFNHHVKV